MTATTIPTFEEVWTTHKNLIYKLALSFNAGNQHRSDLVQCGRIGIHRAIQTYQPEKGGKFISWMITHVKKEMINYLNDNLRTVRIPTNQLNPNHPQYNEDYQHIVDGHTISIDEPVDDEDKTYGDLYLPAHQPEEFKEEDPIIKLLRQYLGQLKERYQTILKLRYFQEKTYLEIATELNTSVENIRQQHDKAINQMQELFGAEKKVENYKRIKPQKNKRI